MTDPNPPAAPEVEAASHGMFIAEAALVLWHRFAPEHHVEWADEPGKAAYLLAATDALSPLASAYRALAAENAALSASLDTAMLEIADRDATITALRQAGAVERGWVIEHGESEPSAPRYWCAGATFNEGPHDPHRSSMWTQNDAHAIRLARRTDAERVRERMMGGIHVRVCQHIWEDGK